MNRMVPGPCRSKAQFVTTVYKTVVTAALYIIKVALRRFSKPPLLSSMS